MRSTLSPTVDIVFKLLFAPPESHDLRRAFLQCVLRPPRPIVRAQVLNPEIAREEVSSKAILLDILVELDDGSRVDVEMQAELHVAFRERSLYDWARAFGAQLERGQPYEALRRMVSVLILNERDPGSTRLHSIYRVREVHNHRTFSPALEIHTLELPRRKEPKAARQADSRVLAWAQFLGATTDEEVKEACVKNKHIAEANERLTDISASPENRELARQRQLGLDGYYITLAGERAAGRQEGRREGRVEVLLDLLGDRFGAVDEALVARVRAASDDELRRWIRRAVTAEDLETVLRGR